MLGKNMGVKEVAIVIMIIAIRCIPKKYPTSVEFQKNWMMTLPICDDNIENTENIAMGAAK